MAEARGALASRRTILEPFAVADAEELLAVFRDRTVRRFLLDGKIVSPAWLRDEIAASEARFAASGAGLWTVRVGGERAIAGFVGFREFFAPPEPQLLYGLLPSRHGRGFATEAAARVVGHAFDALGFVEVRAAVDAPNRASIAVLRRLGMSEEAPRAAWPGTLFFRLERGRWRAAREGRSAPRRARDRRGGLRRVAAPALLVRLVLAQGERARAASSRASVSPEIVGSSFAR